MNGRTVRCSAAMRLAPWFTLIPTLICSQHTHHCPHVHDPMACLPPILTRHPTHARIHSHTHTAQQWRGFATSFASSHPCSCHHSHPRLRHPCPRSCPHATSLTSRPRPTLPARPFHPTLANPPPPLLNLHRQFLLSFPASAAAPPLLLGAYGPRCPNRWPPFVRMHRPVLAVPSVCGNFTQYL